MKIVKLSKKAVSEATEIINNGGAIVCPSDTVYGLVCDATNKKAVEKIFKIKKRPKTKPLGVFVKDIKMAKELAVIDENTERFLKKNTPSKITVILKKRSDCVLAPLVGTTLPASAKASAGTVGIRIIKNDFINKILKEFSKPLAQTSANISGQPPTTKIGEVLAQFQFRSTSGVARTQICPDLIVDAGDLPKSKPSIIIDLMHNKSNILRK